MGSGLFGYSHFPKKQKGGRKGERQSRWAKGPGRLCYFSVPQEGRRAKLDGRVRGWVSNKRKDFSGEQQEAGGAKFFRTEKKEAG